MANKMQRILSKGIGSGLNGLLIATMCENIFNNERIIDAVQKPETLYFAGAFALAGLAYETVRELNRASARRKFIQGKSLSKGEERYLFSGS
jgi:hypothetical protein